MQKARFVSKASKRQKMRAGSEDSFSSQDEESSEGEGESVQQDDSVPLDDCLKEWCRFRKMQTADNQKAYEHCWSEINKQASKIIKSLGTLSVCKFLRNGGKQLETMRVAVTYGGDDVADNQVYFQQLYSDIEVECTPHIALIGTKDCTSARAAVQAIASQLKMSVDKELAADETSTSKVPIEEQEANRQKRLSTLRRVDEFENEEENGIATKNICTAFLHANAQKQRAQGPRKKIDMLDLESIFRKLAGKTSKKEFAVVMFEDAANIDAAVFRDLMVILSRYHTDRQSPLRFGCVAGLQGGNHLWKIDAVLRRREACLLRTRCFKPADAKSVMDKLFEELVLNCKSPLRIDHKTARWLNDRFLRTDCSMRSLLDVLHLAVIEHFSRSRAAFVCAPAKATHGYDMHPLGKLEIAEMVRLKSVRDQFPAVKDSQEMESTIRKMIFWQEQNRDQWPAIFRVVCAIQRALGVKGFSSLRAEFSDLTQASLDALTKQLSNCALDSLDRVVDSLKSTLLANPEWPGHASIRKNVIEITTSVEKLRSRENAASTAPNANVSAPPKQQENDTQGTYVTHASRKKVQRKQLKESLKSVSHSEGRRAFAKWWRTCILFNWDGRRHPLGELFFFRQQKLLNSMTNSQPRTVLTGALGDANHTQTDVCLAFQIMNGHKLHRNLPLLVWYAEFCAAIDGSTADPADEQVKARFMQACSELELLGFITPASNSVDSVKILCHTDNRLR